MEIPVIRGMSVETIRRASGPKPQPNPIANSNWSFATHSDESLLYGFVDPPELLKDGAEYVECLSHLA